jgi:hypothetical protein
MPDDALLTRKQWNELVEMIRDSPLLPSNFERGSVSGEFTGFVDSSATAIIYGEARFAFAIADYVSRRRPGYRPGTFAVQMRPGTERQLEAFGDMDWSAVRQAFRQWLVNLHAEVEAPDLWAQLAGLAIVATVAVSETTHRPALVGHRTLTPKQIESTRRCLSGIFPSSYLSKSGAPQGAR